MSFLGKNNLLYSPKTASNHALKGPQPWTRAFSNMDASMLLCSNIINGVLITI